MFGREPHDREAYQDFEDKTMEEGKAANLRKSSVRHGESHPIFHPAPEQKKFVSMMEKLKQMKGDAHTEALQIEARHEALNDTFSHALNALTSFETENLGRTEREFPDRESFLKGMDPEQAESLVVRHDELLGKYDDALTELVAYQKEQLEMHQE